MKDLKILLARLWKDGRSKITLKFSLKLNFDCFVENFVWSFLYSCRFGRNGCSTSVLDCSIHSEGFFQSSWVELLKIWSNQDGNKRQMRGISTSFTSKKILGSNWCLLSIRLLKWRRDFPVFFLANFFSYFKSKKAWNLAKKDQLVSNAIKTCKYATSFPLFFLN